MNTSIFVDFLITIGIVQCVHAPHNVMETRVLCDDAAVAVAAASGYQWMKQEKQMYVRTLHILNVHN